MFKIKRGANGKMEHYKARLMVRKPKCMGWITMTPLQNSYQYVVSLHWWQWRTWRSINGCQDHIFNGDLEEDIYKEQPQGFTHKETNINRKTSFCNSF
jgi:hypothetical protein